MKKNKTYGIIAISIYIILSIGFSSCAESGKTEIILNGNETNLPNELKGLKIYKVQTGIGYVRVAVLDNEINSTTYKVGKHEESTIILNKQQNKIIEVSQILIENDSVIFCHK